MLSPDFLLTNLRTFTCYFFLSISKQYTVAYFFICYPRPILSRGETIDSCCSEDLVTVLEVSKEIEREQKKPFKVMDRLRVIKKGIMASSLKELISSGQLVLPIKMSWSWLLVKDMLKVTGWSHFHCHGHVQGQIMVKIMFQAMVKVVAEDTFENIFPHC